MMNEVIKDSMDNEISQGEYERRVQEDMGREYRRIWEEIIKGGYGGGQKKKYRSKVVHKM